MKIRTFLRFIKWNKFKEIEKNSVIFVYNLIIKRIKILENNFLDTFCKKVVF